MGYNSDQFSLGISGGFTPNQERSEYRDIIIDRKSRYSVTVFHIQDPKQVKKYFATLKQEDYFRKATHNSYAYRVKLENGSILEGKNDDGEQAAGMCILRELQREEAVDTMLIVTRYFGGIQLHTDRFKNVIDACKIFFERQKKK